MNKLFGILLLLLSLIPILIALNIFFGLMIYFSDKEEASNLNSIVSELLLVVIFAFLIFFLIVMGIKLIKKKKLEN